jgi:pimeloyl-ACP methyl ester carboxylesterase
MTHLPFGAAPGAPALALLGMEPVRAALEYASMRLMRKSALPEGDGHPVVVFPGLATDRTSVAPLTGFLQRLGYAACDWGRGFNTGPQGDIDDWLAELADHVVELHPEHERRISLIGWSLGGIYAREVAKHRPDRVRQVITIGTPFAGSAEQTHAGWVYRLVNGQKPVLDEALMARLRTAPEVPTTSIYSRSDGIVAWQACVQPGDDAHIDNIEVDGSHCGLGWNPRVLAIIADRLQQPGHAWRRYAAAPH